MINKYLLDTNILIYYFNDEPEVQPIFDEIEAGDAEVINSTTFIVVPWTIGTFFSSNSMYLYSVAVSDIVYLVSGYNLIIRSA
jgi:predicted nucleic acid-binding protein